MSQKNQIAITMTTDQMKEIISLITQLKKALAPLTKALTNSEIRGMLKMGDKTLAFVEKVKDYSVSNPEFVPTDMMNVDDFINDVEALKSLSPIYKSINQITTDLKDTLILCGNEAFVPALMYYGNVKFKSKNGVANAKTIHEDLKKRFPSKSNNSSSAKS